MSRKIGHVIKFLTQQKYVLVIRIISDCNLADTQERIENVYANGGHVQHVSGSSGFNPFIHYGERSPRMEKKEEKLGG